MKSNDIPATDDELNQFYGEPFKYPVETDVCNAIRKIHYIDFSPECIQTIIAVLASKIHDEGITGVGKVKRAAIEDAIEALFMELDT